jgi:hypothetical protein
MPSITIDVPDALWDRMQVAPADWSAIAARAFEAHLGRSGQDGPGAAAIKRLRDSRANYLAAQKTASYAGGYAWARDRADFGDLKAMIEAGSYASAADVVRSTRGFSQRDEFGSDVYPSDEMWEAFVDGATQLYRDVADQL